MLRSILSWYGVDQLEDAIDNSLERFETGVGFLSLTSKLSANACPRDLSIPMSFIWDTVGKEVLSFGELVVEVLKDEETKNLFTIFPIGATMQDGGKRKRSNDGHVLLYHPKEKEN